MVGKADDDEQNRKHNESKQLDWFTADRVNGGNSYPVTRDGTGTDEDQVPDGVAIEYLVNIMSTCPSNRTQNNRVVKAKTVES